jgi:hypothetical protein
VAAASTIAAVGSAARHVLFPSEADHSVAAASAVHFYAGFVNKHDKKKF